MQSSGIDDITARFRTNYLETRQIYAANYSKPPQQDPVSNAVYLSSLIHDEYRTVKDELPVDRPAPRPPAARAPGQQAGRPAPTNPAITAQPSSTALTIPSSTNNPVSIPSSAALGGTSNNADNLVISSHHGPATDLIKSRQRQAHKPVWHPPFVLQRILVGHSGWVKCIDVDQSNDFFVTGSVDNTAKVWSLGSGELKYTFTGHVAPITNVKISPRHTYLYTASEDNDIKCYDLEINQQVRQYHGHLKGVTSMALHPTLDLLITGSRDKTIKVWDMRTRQAIRTLEGHRDRVSSVVACPTDPQIISASDDTTLKIWDIVSGKAMLTVAHHAKSIRNITLSPFERTILSCSTDSLKKWKINDNNIIFMHNYQHSPPEIINTLSCNNDGIVAAGCDFGSLHLYDYYTGYKYQCINTPPIAGSLSNENGIFDSTFDMTGTRLLTCNADKTIKIYAINTNATPQTHPIQYDPYASFR